MNIQIVSYSDQHHAAFKEINVEWLERYNLLESHDLEILDDPKQTILDAGGAIFIAQHNNTVIGSAALMKMEEGIYELVKMTVVDAWQGKGISKLLLDACLQKAEALQVKKIILFSNHQLQAALGLYEKYGFKYIEVEDSPFLTADIKMELIF
jgi:putative acetyltransferase